jgi:hypothetical protein
MQILQSMQKVKEADEGEGAETNWERKGTAHGGEAVLMKTKAWFMIVHYMFIIWQEYPMYGVFENCLTDFTY